MLNSVVKPRERGTLQKLLGKEYFILKRKISWAISQKHYAHCRDEGNTAHFSYIKHKTPLIRKLKDVDMQLQYNKVTNLKLAVQKINSIIIYPGEVFSFWRLVGRPTKGKGYLDGMTLSNGQVGKGTGGGLCQLGNLIYWMALHTPLTVKERWRHSYDVFPDVNRKLPFGSGATLSYNYVDLQILNNTPDVFVLKFWFDEENLNGEILADKENIFRYEVFETEHVMQQQWWGGYTRHNQIWRHKTNKVNHTMVTEFITENHAIMMYSPLLEAGK